MQIHYLFDIILVFVYVSISTELAWATFIENNCLNRVSNEFHSNQPIYPKKWWSLELYHQTEITHRACAFVISVLILIAIDP